MPRYTVKYWAATYAGTRTVNADDEDEAIAKVRAEIRRGMTLPMYSDGYKIIDTPNTEEENDDDYQ